MQDHIDSLLQRLSVVSQSSDHADRELILDFKAASLDRHVPDHPEVQSLLGSDGQVHAVGHEARGCGIAAQHGTWGLDFEAQHTRSHSARDPCCDLLLTVRTRKGCLVPATPQGFVEHQYDRVKPACKVTSTLSCIAFLSFPSRVALQNVRVL